LVCSPPVRRHSSPLANVRIPPPLLECLAPRSLFLPSLNPPDILTRRSHPPPPTPPREHRARMPPDLLKDVPLEPLSCYVVFLSTRQSASPFLPQRDAFTADFFLRPNSLGPGLVSPLDKPCLPAFLFFVSASSDFSGLTGVPSRSFPSDLNFPLRHYMFTLRCIQRWPFSTTLLPIVTEAFCGPPVYFRHSQRAFLSAH